METNFDEGKKRLRRRLLGKRGEPFFLHAIATNGSKNGGQALRAFVLPQTELSKEQLESRFEEVARLPVEVVFEEMAIA